MNAPERIRADCSGAARKRFFDDGQVPLGDVPTPVLRSWQRCVEAGQEASRPVSFEPVSRGRIREIGERGRPLVEAANAEIHQLARTISSAKMIVMLTDASGGMIDSVGDFNNVSPRLVQAARKGIDFSERTIGTNGIGTALVERSPVAVIAREHFFESNAVLTCIAAPLFAPDGSIAGVLDVSGDYHAERPDFSDVVVTSALAIENRMLYELHGTLLLTFSPRDELLATPWEAILAFDPGGILLGSNATARRLLRLPGGPCALRFDDLFDSTFAGALRHIGQHDRPWSIQSASGLRVSARLHSPAIGHPVPASQSAAKRIRPQQGSARRQSTLKFLQAVCEDEGTRKTVERAQCAYDRGVPALLVGETGTGKELVARALHYLGTRSDRPFIAVNCASFPESLIEAELFGYADGAFTGARRGGAQGKLELADGGTLFLDEIGDMPPASQAKLLRVLQERCVVRLGENRERPIDVALICATHQDLPKLIAERVFREDLYYRINGLSVTLPPLRNRSNVLQLARHLLVQQVGHPREFSESAIQLLRAHRWPGNLRQLGHVVASAAALVGDGQLIEPEDFPEDFVAQSGETASGQSQDGRGALPLVSLDQAEAEMIDRALSACNGNVSAAARRLGVSRSTMYNKLKRR